MIRTYTGIDFINYVEGFNSNLATVAGMFASVAAIATPVNKFDVSTNATAANDQSGNGSQAMMESNWEYEVSGDLDFDIFPAIPDNALIQSVEVKVDVEIYGNSLSSYAGGGGTTSGSIEAHIAIYRGLDQLSNLSLDDTESEGVSGTTPQQVDVVGADHFTATELFDYTGAPINKTQLITDFTSWSATLAGISTSTTQSFNPAPTQHAECNITVRIDGIRITITYVSGPEVSYTISPTGGNVQVGQVLTVTGPGVAELDFAALTGSGVIPIEPKVISEDEVTLEVPYPSLGPCYDCFPSCPECDAAFTPCDADFESDACQEAIQACLDCLVTCLEDLQLAEECQESTQNPPNVNVSVTIIVGTQFSGSVLLGNFVIITADGSGLYKFTTGQTHDELYTAERDGTTYNVKIPNPGGKTGFFRS